MIFPEVLYILEFNKRNIERAVRDFPLPDSPTNPTILFLGISKEMLFNNVLSDSLLISPIPSLSILSKISFFKN